MLLSVTLAMLSYHLTVDAILEHAYWESDVVCKGWAQGQEDHWLPLPAPFRHEMTQEA